MRNKSLRDFPRLKAEAEQWVHAYVRLRDCLKTTGTYHHCKCFTCLADVDYKQIQAGHFLHGKLDFDPDNMRGQCVNCNYSPRGMHDIYEIKLVRMYGEKWVEDLILRANQLQKKSRFELEEIISEYKAKCLQLSNA